MPLTAPEDTVEIHGFALREIRVREGRKVEDLAEAVGCHRSYIARIETGSSRRVSRVFFNKLCNELEIRDRRALFAIAPLRATA